MKTRVYQYGLLRPTGEADLVWEQLHSAHRYRNLLTELERKRRDSLRSIMSSYADIAVLEQAATEANDKRQEALGAVKYARKCSRSRSESQAARQQLQAARKLVKVAREALRERRRALLEDESARLQCDEVNAWAGAQRRAARAECGCYWGTYLLVEAAMDAAQKSPLYDGAEPNDPRFVRWRAEGSVGVQVQRGISCGDVFGSDTRIQIDPVDELAWHSETRGQRRRLSRTALRLRVGSGPKGEPVFAQWPMVMHRPLPEAGQIMRATVSVKRYAGRDKWSVELTVRLPDSWQHGICGKGRVAVDIGWRAIDAELRVAYWRGQDGRHGELRLNERTLDGLTMPSGLRSIRDRVFDLFKGLFGQWLREAMVKTAPEIPEWFAEATETLSRWRSTERADRLLKQWAEQRWEGDEVGWAVLCAWRTRNQHLWDWEANQRRGSLANRREQYRVFASELADQYGSIVLEDFNMRQVARRPRTAEEGDDNQRARSNRQLASVSELRLALCNCFNRRGGSEVRVPAPGTTIVCSQCLELDKFDVAAELVHTCVHCGARWDQDDNATVNMLRLAAESPSGPKKPAAAGNGKKNGKEQGKEETKWQRVARLRQEKKQRQLGGARA
ncbi:MAG: hypothetical protein JRD89_07015 [Deltaproteobacteria bacterium]|nr:hypothetical protein [Deltaproteobacteria bacterium]